MTKPGIPKVNLQLATALLACVAVAASSRWLWLEYTFYAVGFYAFALFGGFAWLLPANSSARIVAIGAGIGLLVGVISALAGSSLAA